MLFVCHNVFQILALHWDSYFNVLAEIARWKTPHAEYTITFKEFLAELQRREDAKKLTPGA